VTLSGVAGVRLDTDRMELDARRPLSGDVTTGSPLRLTLAGPFGKGAHATIDGRPATVLPGSGGAIAVAVPAGRHRLVISPLA
jgi:hypothetical protein